MNAHVHHQAYNRINEKRSSIGSGALSLIKRHIDTLSGDSEVRDWIRWALCPDGPLFFKNPSPFDSPSNHRDPKYQVSPIFPPT